MTVTDLDGLQDRLNEMFRAMTGEDMPPNHFILDDDNNVVNVPGDDVLVWAHIFESDKIENRRVRHHRWFGYRISTVFLGLNHNHTPHHDRTPIVFETMIFKPPYMGELLGKPHMMMCDEIYCQRYATWEQAERGHRHACRVMMGRSLIGLIMYLVSIPADLVSRLIERISLWYVPGRRRR